MFNKVRGLLFIMRVGAGEVRRIARTCAGAFVHALLWAAVGTAVVTLPLIVWLEVSSWN